ncbi:MAG: amidohydrolase family protein [Chloroflexota bacterium]
MKAIDLEAHFLTREYLDYLRQRRDVPREVREGDSYVLWYHEDVSSPRSPAIDEQMADMGEGRWQRMTAGGVTGQVLSLSPPTVQYLEPEEGVYWAKKINDTLSGVVKSHPERYVGLACVAPQKPEEAAAEIGRAMTELGLKGVLMQSHVGREYLDAAKYRVIFEAAEKYGAPIYLHPDIPIVPMLSAYSDYGFDMCGPILGYAADAALQTMRLILSGLFDEFPKLQIILGHMGEGLPYWMGRMDFSWLRSWTGEKPFNIERRPSDYLRTNFTVTTSGMSFLPAFMCAYMALGADRIAFAVDYPYEDSGEARKFILETPISDADKEKILHGNAERLFHL